jgi:hypothetical protein
MQEDRNAFVPWKRYILAVTETVITFTLASFLLGLYILHRGNSGILVNLLVGLVYAALVVFTIWRMVRKLSLQAIMLMIPIAPLVVLIIVVVLIHFLQYFI